MRIKLLLFLLLFTFASASAHAQARSWNAGDPVQDAAGLQVADEVVDSYRLTTAHPNPFNPSTQFMLTVAKDQEVHIEVYNLLGRRVDVLYEGMLAAQQRYTFTFEADNLPSGLYLIRVAGEQFTSTQRVTLLK